VTYETLLYAVADQVATITLNRPDRLNTIVPPMPDEFEAAVMAAVRDDSVKVVVLRGAGRSFCAGYDFGAGFHHWDEAITTEGRWDPGKDFVFATAPAISPTQKFMSMWRAPKPVIAQVHGWCLGGGSETALCADIVIASEDARIGTPYSRMWGCHLSGMWIYCLGLAKAKGVRPDRQAPLGHRSRLHRPHQSGSALRTARGRGRPHRPPAGRHPRLPAGGHEAGGQPGLRQTWAWPAPRRWGRSSTA
jgi:hypothetical protein